MISLFLLPTAGTAQSDERAERWRADCERSWNDDRARVCEVRTYSMPAASRISVDGGDNGGVKFFGSDRRDVKVVARVQTSADDDASASEIARQIKDAIVKGVRPDGTKLIDLMPFAAYAKMTPQDLDSIVAYLHSLKPIGHKVR